MKKIRLGILKRKYTWITVALVIMSATSAYGIYKFIDEHTFRSPIILQAPIQYKQYKYISPTSKPSPKPKQHVQVIPEPQKAYAEAPVVHPEQATPAYEGQELNNKILATAPHTESFYKLYIYQHESGVSPTKYNSAGCVGLGQACPASKLLAVCPNLDYNCEDDWFSNYAQVRYGGWEGAYNFWIENKWW